MNNKEPHPAGSASSPGSHNEISPHGFELSAKLTAKLEQLAQWRIHPASIKFPEGAPKFEGGYATVSRALLAVPSDRKDGTDRPADTKEGVVHGRKDKSSSGAAESEGNSGAERRKQGTGKRMMMKLRSMGRGLMEYWGTGSSIFSREAYKTAAVKKMKMSGDVARILKLTLREAEFLVELSHPNIITLDGFVEDIPNNIIWLVFPWVDNGSLRDFVASADWEIPERISLISDVADGVKYIHSRKPPIRHGDLKSINIMVNSKSRAIITDFGSASRQTVADMEKGKERIETSPEAGPRFEATFCESTQTMTLAGDNYTLRWAAPELLNEGEPGLWSDIWALGWVAYEPMVIPDTTRVGDTAGVVGRSPKLLMELGSMHSRQGDYTNALKYHTNALSVCADTADKPGKAKALWVLARVHQLQNDYSQAITFYSECLQVNSDIGWNVGMAHALYGLAGVHQAQNNYSQAMTFYSECLQIHTDIGDNLGRAPALYGLAELHRAQNDYTQAATFYFECLQISTDIGHREGRASALWALAEVHRAQNDYNQALTFYSEYLQIHTDIASRASRAAALQGMAEVHRSRKDHSQATAFLSEALEIFTAMGVRDKRASTLWCIADTHRDQDDHNSAIQHYEQAAEIFKQIGHIRDQADVLEQAADLRRLMERKGVTAREPWERISETPQPSTVVLYPSLPPLF
ncbi:hypothetical protein FS837_001058 [Tulasnella sp. UAMH 9824]|nr:hypothetical protein FS837_001058 [Tulasnella sp. UAMH 9824]